MPLLRPPSNPCAGRSSNTSGTPPPSLCAACSRTPTPRYVIRALLRTVVFADPQPEARPEPPQPITKSLGTCQLDRAVEHVVIGGSRLGPPAGCRCPSAGRGRPGRAHRPQRPRQAVVDRCVPTHGATLEAIVAHAPADGPAARHVVPFPADKTSRDAVGFFRTTFLGPVSDRRSLRGSGRGATGCGHLRRELARSFAQQGRRAQDPPPVAKLAAADGDRAALRRGHRGRYNRRAGLRGHGGRRRDKGVHGGLNEGVEVN